MASASASSSRGSTGSTSSRTYAIALLGRQLKELVDSPPDMITVGISDDNLFKWNVTIQGPPATPYEGGLFGATLDFPDDFPENPPVMTFVSDIFHPNVYPDGKVCISILHKPGTDRFNEMETAEERWRPILSVEAVLVSILSLFSDPNDSSPANIDAGKLWREDRKMFNRRARRCAQRTLE